MGTGAIARGQVRQKRSEGEIYAAAQAEHRSASGCNAFYLSTGEKPDSINLSQKSQEVIRFCFSKRNIFQPRLDSGNNVLLCCKTFPRRYPRSLKQLHTCMVFSRFFTEKVTNNAGPKFMCLSSSLFVTYFLAVYIRNQQTCCIFHSRSCYESVFHVSRSLFYSFPSERSSHILPPPPPSSETHLRFWMCYRALMDSFEPPYAFSISWTAPDRRHDL